MKESSAVRPAKIADHHLARTAIVYVRQSTLQQLDRNQESTRLQYSLSNRLERWGWRADQIVTIDDDLGQSGASIEGRPGFQRIIAEVTMEHVGLIIGRDVSRLARSCRDWYRLLELCAPFETLIADTDGVYDPSDYNDRLLLGLKGTMSEAELHMIKERLHAGKLAKARRGELKFLLPVGYVWSSDDEIVKDPDKEAQAVVELIFEVFDERQTVGGVLRYLVDSGLKIPHRRRKSPRRGELEWRRPNHSQIKNMIAHPIYAGAYVYGRRQTDPRRATPGSPSSGRTVVGPDEWHVLLKDHHLGYIRWERFESHRKQLEHNRAVSVGSPRQGQAMLGGLVRCGRCGYRMGVNYAHKNTWRYICTHQAAQYAGGSCQSLGGKPLDELIEGLVLQAIEPASIELSLEAIEAAANERDRLEELWKKKLERADYKVERAFEQYDAVDPKNRLVAQTLEERLEEAMRAKQVLERDFERKKSEWRQALCERDRRQICALAQDLPALWHAEETEVEDRQRIIQTMIEEIIVEVQGATERVAVRIHWAGGDETEATIRRLVARWEQLSYYDEMIEQLRKMFANGRTHAQMLDELNRRGYRPPRGQMVSIRSLRTILNRLGLKRQDPIRARKGLELGADEWTVSELARELNMPRNTLYSWISRGDVAAAKRQIGPKGTWIVSADDSTVDRLRRRRQGQQSSQ